MFLSALSSKEYYLNKIMFQTIVNIFFNNIFLNNFKYISNKYIKYIFGIYLIKILCEKKSYKLINHCNCRCNQPDATISFVRIT